MQSLPLYGKALLCLALIANSSSHRLSDEEFEEFASEVEEFVDATSTYIFSTNNDEYFSSEDADSVDYGTFDFIIVGGGTAGGILANRLTEQENVTVLVVEAGEARTAIIDVLGLNSYMVTSDWNWGYNSTQQNHSCLGNPENRCSVPRGKGLGGTSSINDAFLARGNRKDFDQWADLGDIGWSFEDCLPYFKKIEKVTFSVNSSDSPYRGFDGMQSASIPEDTPELTEAFISAFEALGNQYVDYNGETQYGVGRPQYYLDGNTRSTTAYAYIYPIANRTNLNITLESLVTKVLISNKTATGIEFWKNGEKYTATAGKEVIISAGTINSPQILMLSGIGRTEELSKLDIEVIADLPVGENYQDHTMVPAIFYRTNGSWYDTTLSENLNLWRDNHRPLTVGLGLQAVVFFNSEGNDSIIPEIEILAAGPPVVSTSLGEFFGYDDEYVETLSIFNSTTDLCVVMTLLHPRITGKIVLKSNSAKDYPVIDYDYLGNDDDVEVIYNAIQYSMQLNETEAFKSLGAYQIFPDVPDCDPYYELRSKEWWFCTIRYTSAAGFHALGTTRFGVDPEKSVVDPSLKVHGFTNLRVVDAGVIPSEVSGHTNAIVSMVAEKAADIIKSEY